MTVFTRLNWEDVLDEVKAKLSKMLITPAVLQGKSFHSEQPGRLLVLAPSSRLMQAVQRLLEDFFWSGQHWLLASVLCLCIFLDPLSLSRCHANLFVPLLLPQVITSSSLADATDNKSTITALSPSKSPDHNLSNSPLAPVLNCPLFPRPSA